MRNDEEIVDYVVLWKRERKSNDAKSQETGVGRPTKH